MDMLLVNGTGPLEGRVRVDGSKNATLPLMAAALMVDGPVELRNVPHLVDVQTMVQLLQSLGATVQQQQDRMEIDAGSASSVVADYDLVRRMRAGVCVLGPLLTRFGSARVSLPGGCNIGHRPIDVHLRGLSALGADIRLTGGYVVAEAKRLRGTDILLTGPCGSSVTGTCNVMTAAVLAHGRTVIRGAACEPEVGALAAFLTDCGGQISGAGSPTITIDGVDQLRGSNCKIIPDRIEAATLAIAAAISRGTVQIEDAPIDHLASVLARLRDIGVNVQTADSTLTVDARSPLKAANVSAVPYPGVPTDTQAQFMALLSTTEGTSMITDHVFPDRFMHVSELVRMGARIQRTGSVAVIQGISQLSGAPLMASDLRASAALLLAAVASDGPSELRRVYHLDRGYVRLEQKLNALGADITRCREPSVSARV